jgi:hypothetical protein
VDGFVTQDPEALRSIIDQAINSETFLNAIAANLAKLIKPSIKTALDTIQPVVETVYNHEVLLRKTNRSVENILERLDSVAETGNLGPIDAEGEGPSISRTLRNKSNGGLTSAFGVEDIKHLIEQNNAQNAAKLSELLGSVEASNAKITEMTEGIHGINAALGPTKEVLDALKDLTEESNNKASVMQGQLDQLKADIGDVISTVGSDLGSNVKAINQKIATQDTLLLSSHTAKLDSISTDLEALKRQSNALEALQHISAKLEALQESVQAGISSSNDSFAIIAPKISNVLTAINAQSNILAEIKAGDSSTEILAAVKKSNDLHESHTEVLREINNRSVSVGIESAPTNISSELETLHALSADLTSLKESIKIGLTSNAENLTDLGTKVDDVLTTIEAHRVADPSSEILAAVQKSNASHAAHATALDEIKALSVSPVPARSDSDNLSLEPQVAAIITTLGTHTSVLEEIKTSSVSNTGPVPPSFKSEALETNISTIINMLDSHTALLTELKDDVGAEILTILHDINETHTGQNAILAEIRESDVSDEILTALHTSNDSHTSHTATLNDIHAAVKTSNDSLVSHVGMLDEMKNARVDEPDLATEVGNLGALESQVGAIMTALEGQNTVLSAIKDATNASNESHVTHAATLKEIKDATATSNEFHNSHTASLADLKEIATGSMEAHSSHSSTLAEIKDATKSSNDLHASHITALTELKATHTGSPPDAGKIADLSTLNAQINDITTALEILAKDGAANPELLATIKKSNELITVNHELLVSQTALLDSVKKSNSREDILDNIASLKLIIEESKAGIDAHGALVKDLQEATKASHSGITHSIEALALGGAAGAGAELTTPKDDVSRNTAEILEEMKAVRTIVDKSSATLNSTDQSITSMAAQLDINHTTVITSITALSDELKSEIDASGTEITDSVTALSGEVKNVGLNVLGNAIEKSGKNVETLTAVVEELSRSLTASAGTGDHAVERGRDMPLKQEDEGQLNENVVAIAASAADDITPQHLEESHGKEEPESLEPAAKEVEPVIESEPAQESIPEAAEKHLDIPKAAEGETIHEEEAPGITPKHEKVPVQEAPVQEAPVQEAPVQEALVQEEAPAQEDKLAHEDA